MRLGPATTAWVALLLVVMATGCIQRRLTIRSNPPGALVFIDNYEIGTTPVSTDYIYYGKRRIRVVKDGYEILNVDQFIAPPWYEILPLEFVTENLVPFEIRDQRTLEFELMPQVVVSTEQLLGRAENLRTGSRTENYVPPPSVKPPTTIVPPPWVPTISGPSFSPAIIEPLPPISGPSLSPNGMELLPPIDAGS